MDDNIFESQDLLKEKGIFSNLQLTVHVSRVKFGVLSIKLYQAIR